MDEQTEEIFDTLDHHYVEKAIKDLNNREHLTYTASVLPNPSRLSETEIAEIIRVHTTNITEITEWQRILSLIVPEDRDEDVETLEVLLAKRFGECSQIIAVLSSVN